jgi:hypothetical protein
MVRLPVRPRGPMPGFRMIDLGHASFVRRDLTARTSVPVNGSSRADASFDVMGVA